MNTEKPFSIIILIALCLLAGFWIGTKGSLFEDIHTVAFALIPIGGWCAGLGFGVLEVTTARLFQIGIGSRRLVLLAVVAGLAWFMGEAGFYATHQLAREGTQGHKPFVPVRDVMTFGQYIDLRLSSSEFQSKEEGWTEASYGRTGTVLIFLLDHFGAMFGAVVVLSIFRSATEYCWGCRQYRRELKTIRLYSDASLEDFEPELERVKQTICRTPSFSLLAAMSDLNIKGDPRSALITCSISLKQCKSCLACSIQCTVSKRTFKGNRIEIPELGFRLDKPGGQSPDKP